MAAGLVAAIASACNSGGQPAPSAGSPAAAIRTNADRYELRPGPHGSEATIIATFTAPADTAVHLLHCNGAISWGLQRLAGGRWTDAWGAETNGCLSAPIVVPAGAAHVETLTVVSREGLPTPGTVRHAVPPGTYRVAWYQVLTSFDPDLRPMGAELSLPNRVSAPIRIESAP